jgi:hypothetical protein
VIFVGETVHSMLRPLSYDRSKMSHENLKRTPAPWRALYAPTLVTKETTPNAEAAPARPGADRHALDHKPPGVSSIASRQLDASRSSPPNGPAPPSVGMLDFRWTRGAVEIE